ncbi:uncharacterized protein LOC122052439 [Zingiber officinale]|uniref:ENT domain-containing protein n=1 Tax=Zingiber officinale TaxID=94328 RepID=A0A8J5H906_ZINOF|nr:uncharacterized protein LOC122052439 [Zingiber officinale]KAG6521899.1 hypothetical protein ZIOFF_019033 [Zingiber officinale]
MNKVMKFKPGDEVEILRRNEEPNGSWFPAVISSVLVDKYSVRYKLFISPRGKPIVETVDGKDVRPSPPFVPCKQDWSIGEIAEVLDTHSWKVAKIAKILKNGYVVAKVLGSIQLKMFPLYDVRVRQAWQTNHWVNKIANEKYFDCGLIPSSSKHTTKVKVGAHQEPYVIQKVGTKHSEPYNAHKFARKQFGAMPHTTLNRDLSLRYISTPDHEIRATDRKRKPSSEADDPDLLTKETLPRKVNAVTFSKVSDHGNRIPQSSKTRNMNSQIHTDRLFLDEHDMRLFRRPMGVAEEADECSIASCSSNDIAESYSGGMRKHSTNSSGESSAFMSLSSYKGEREQENTSKDKLAASIHMLELHAYRSTLQALYASGPLSWEQESLLTNLRLSLNITNEEHLLHLKQLLSV